MTSDTATSSYWINWRVLICAIWVLLSTSLALFLIWKYEGYFNTKRGSRETVQENAGDLYKDETWRPCLKGIHPAWLLAFRLFAFFVLLVLLIITAFVDGGFIFYFYTQWTFASITVYFGKVNGERVDNGEIDAEQGTSNTVKSSVIHEEPIRDPADLWDYLFQIIFQMNAGTVMLTDCVFWFIIGPFLAIKDYNLNFLIISMHTVNVVFLLGDTALNSLRFPWFRIGYFYLWTVSYVIFQWIVHACVRIWWPYPFLDLSSRFSPLWYFSVALMHIPCYGVFFLVMKWKHNILSSRYPQIYQFRR